MLPLCQPDYLSDDDYSIVDANYHKEESIDFDQASSTMRTLHVGEKENGKEKFHLLHGSNDVAEF